MAWLGWAGLGWAGWARAAAVLLLIRAPSLSRVPSAHADRLGLRVWLQGQGRRPLEEFGGAEGKRRKEGMCLRRPVKRRQKHVEYTAFTRRSRFLRTPDMIM